MTESKLQKDLVKYAEKRGVLYIRKIHGDGMQKRGLPDLIGCYQGIFLGMEVKLPGRENRVTKLQAINLRKIREAGGVSGIVTSREEVDQLLGEIVHGLNRS